MCPSCVPVSRTIPSSCVFGSACSPERRLLMFGLLHAGKIIYCSKRSQDLRLIVSLQGMLTPPCIPYCHRFLRRACQLALITQTHATRTHTHTRTRANVSEGSSGMRCHMHSMPRDSEGWWQCDKQRWGGVASWQAYFWKSKLNYWLKKWHQKAWDKNSIWNTTADAWKGPYSTYFRVLVFPPISLD